MLQACLRDTALDEDEDDDDDEGDKAPPCWLSMHMLISLVAAMHCANCKCGGRFMQAS